MALLGNGYQPSPFQGILGQPAGQYNVPAPTKAGLDSFDVNKLLTNPLFHAGMALLGSRSGTGARDAMQGLMQGAQYKTQLEAQQREQAERERKQAALSQLGEQNPALAPYIGTGLEGQAMTMLGQQARTAAGQAGIQGSPLKLASGNLGYMTKTGEIVDTGEPFYSAPTTFEAGGIRYNINPITGQAQPLVDPAAVAETAGGIAGAKTGAQERAKVEVEKEVAQPKAKAKLATAKRSAQNVLDAISEAKKSTGALTTGLLGSMTRGIPGTPAFDLTKTVETVKANLGFDRLQQMRDESPTGGALGQVAIQELEALQSTVSNLDTGQSPDQMMAALEKIEQHYNNYLAALEQSYQEQYAPQAETSDIQSLVNKYAD